MRRLPAAQGNSKPQEIHDLVLKIRKETGWGAGRIKGEATQKRPVKKPGGPGAFSMRAATWSGTSETGRPVQQKHPAR